jgi:uncharacterized membrane protein
MSAKEFAEVFRDYLPELTAGLAILFVIVLLGAYFLRRFRDHDGDDENEPGQLLTKFGEMHSRGDLSETEYRTIKTVLATEVQNELKSTAEKG